MPLHNSDKTTMQTFIYLRIYEREEKTVIDDKKNNLVVMVVWNLGLSALIATVAAALFSLFSTISYKESMKNYTLSSTGENETTNDCNEKPSVPTSQPPERHSPLVTFIVTTYNRPEFLKRFIENIQSQTNNDWEIIIGDESVDGYGNAIAQNSNDHRVHWFPMPPPAVNDWGQTSKEALVPAAKGEWLCFPNDDAQYEITFIDELVTAAEKENAQLAYCDCTIGRLGGLIITQPKHCHIDVGGFIVHWKWMPAWTDKSYGGDGLLVERIVSLGAKTVKVPVVLYHTP